MSSVQVAPFGLAGHRGHVRALVALRDTQTQALTYYKRSLGPDKADSEDDARLRDQHPGRGPVWARVSAVGEVAR